MKIAKTKFIKGYIDLQLKEMPTKIKMEKGIHSSKAGNFTNRQT